MISKLFCLLGLLSLFMQGREASVVPVVETIRETTLASGEEGLLKCAYERKAYAVYWKFLSDSSSINLLVVLDQHYQVGDRSGPGYDEGRFNITNDYSLLIHDVSVEDEGRYICEVSDFETGQVLRNYTNVTVTVQAVRPFVRVNDCGSDIRVSVNVTDNPKASCMIQITPNQRHVQLDCFVEGAKPQVDMSWFDNTTLRDLSNGSSLVLTDGKREGTVDQKLTVILEASEFQSEQEYYFTCTAEGRAVDRIASVTVGIISVPPEVSTSAIVSSLVMLVVVVVVVLISVLLWKKYKRPQHRYEGVRDRRPSLDIRRTEILDYSPDKPTTMNEETDHINLGVFGLAKAGKSSLINSLIFSLKGYYPSEADFGATQFRESDITRPIEMIELTDHIHLLNYKGMVDYHPTNLEEIFSQIKGQSMEIHCPIFICDSRYTKEQREEFMKVLSNDVSRYFGRGIMVVIPDKGDLDDAHDSIKTKMADTIGIPENHVWIFNNYTLESHEEDVERSITFLNFISHCLTVAKGNEQFRATQKENQPFQSIQKEKVQIPNVQKENQQIPNAQKENQPIPRIQKENQHNPNIQKENQHDPNIQKENQHNPNSQKENQHNPNRQTEAWGCNII